MNSADPRPADAQHSRQGCRVHLHHQCLPILVTNQFPIWCQTNHCKNYILPPQSPSGEEADREVAAICRVPEYYRVRSHVCRIRRYFMYNTLDDFGEATQQKRLYNNSPSVQRPPVEH